MVSIFSLFFLVFNHDFVICIDFTHIAVSNTAANDVTNEVTRIEYLIQTYSTILRCFASNDVNLLARAFTVCVRPFVEYTVPLHGLLA